MNGMFGYYKLMEWWESSFTDDEKASFKLCYKDEEDFNSLIHGNIDYSSQTVIGFLQNMGNNLARSKKYDLALKFLSQGECLATLGTATDTHFIYRGFLEYYSEYSPHHNNEKLVEYAQKQISISALAAKEMIDKNTWYKIAHKGYEIYYRYLKINNKKEEAKSLKSKARKEKWNYSYID